MRIYTSAGDLAFKTFTFPDGQPHFKLETYEREFNSVTLEMSFRTPCDLFTAAMVSDVLRQQGYSEVCLDVRYLLGARMDREISNLEPHTLRHVARMINSCGFTRVRLLDVHSTVATKLIKNSENILPLKVIQQVQATLGNPQTVAPDKGSWDRVNFLSDHLPVQCSKERDPQTGKLSNFKVHEPGFVRDRECLIIDDICDGGGTFVGLAKELRRHGAKKINLYVTHGIFSRGPDTLNGIDRVFTTDSYCTGDFGYVPVLSVTVIRISMKDL